MLIPFDVDEDGRMDILVQKQYPVKITTATGDSKEILHNTIELIYNNQVFDAFYIKSEMISVKSSKPEEGSTATVGASFRYVVSGIEEEKRV